MFSTFEEVTQVSRLKCPTEDYNPFESIELLLLDWWGMTIPNSSVDRKVKNC